MMKLIILNGHSCSGKSQLAREIFKIKKDFFHLKSDSIKRFWKNYARKKREKEKVHDLVLYIFEKIANSKIDILAEIHKNENILKLAEKNGYQVFIYNIETHYEEAFKRFEERLENDVNGFVSNKSPEVFKELYDQYLEQKNPKNRTFDTSVLSSEKIAKEILADIE